jgi:myosin head (motor domain)
MVEDGTKVVGTNNVSSMSSGEPDLTGLTQDQLMDLFVDDLVKEKGQNISEAEKQKIADDLKDAVMTEILMSLPDYLVNKINDSFENGTASEEMIESVVEESGIDASKIAEKVMIRFRDDYLNKEEQ